MLILQDKKDLKEQEVWLYEAYKKIISKIIKIATNPNSSIDPFSSEYIGKNSVKYDTDYYNSLLEITSYFWASKAGRGTLLQKTTGLLAGKKADQDVYLSNFLNEMIKAGSKLDGKISAKFKKKFDLINVTKDNLAMLEIKNRADSGGTSGRREAFKKFFEVCDAIENNTVSFTDGSSSKEYTLPKLLEIMGIKKCEMLMGLFYNVKGSEATIDDDKKDGFFGESKSLVEKYGNNHLGIKYDSDSLEINFTKDRTDFTIKTVYGSDSTKRFTGGKLTLDQVFKSVFPKSRDDIWLALNVGIDQRNVLLKHKTNHIMEMQDFYKKDSDFKKLLKNFKVNSSDRKLLGNIIDKIQNAKSALPKISDQDMADCLYISSRVVR